MLSKHIAVPPPGRKYSRAPEYAVPTSRLLRDPSLPHRQAMPNSRSAVAHGSESFFWVWYIHGGMYTYSSGGASLCSPWAVNRAPQYPRPTSRLLQDPCLARHRHAISNSRKRRSTLEREFCGCCTFAAARMHMIQQQWWWYSSRVHARIAALLAVRTGHISVEVVVQQLCARSWDTRRDYKLVGCLAFFKSAYFLLFFLQHGAVNITRGGHQYPAVTKLCHP